MTDSLGHYRLMADVLDSLHVGLCLFDADDRTLLWNRTFLRLFPEHAGKVTVGEPYADNLRRFYTARLPPEEHDTIDQCIAEGIVRHRTQTDPFIFEHRGQWVRIASQPVPGIGRVRIWTPIAPPDRGRGRFIAKGDSQSREVMPFAADEGDGASVIDRSGRIVRANQRFARIFQLIGPDDAVGRTHAEVYEAAWRNEVGGQAIAAPWLQTLAEAERFTGAPFELPLPGDRWLRILQQRMPDGTVVSSFADISAMKTLQRELSLAREGAERASRAKDEFLATVSHELRTPMNGILGMLDFLDDGRLEQDQAARLGLARQSAEALLGLVDDILTFSRLGSGHVTADQLPASPAKIVDTIARLMQPRAVEKGLRLRWTLAPDVPDLLLCDPARLRQVLLNLIGNAVKFTEQGEITVAMRRGDDLPNGRFLLEIEVTDTGIGVPAAVIGAIFDPFVQADRSISRKFGGTGLGLAICRQLVRIMGGEISVASTEGQGSRFSFSVACGMAEQPAAVAPAASVQPAAPRLPPLRVLVVDDQPTNREVARLYLLRLGLTVTTVASGAEALAACDTAFDLILMDLQMPGMDGFAATRAIRASRSPNAATPIVALTAHAGESHRVRCLEAGMQGFVAKPIRLEALASEIAAAVSCQAPDRIADPVASPADPPTVEVLDAARVASVAELMPAAEWARLVADFAEYARDTVASIAAAAEADRPHRELVHALKGTSWNFGARRLGDLLSALEGFASAELRPHLPELRQLLEATLTAMANVPSRAGSG